MVVGDGKRTHRSQRHEQPPAMVMTARDKEIIRTVADFRVLRQDQIQALFFGSRSTTQYRLSHLFQHGFLNRVFLPVSTGSSPTLYVLGKAGLELLRTEFGYDDAPVSPLDNHTGHEFLAHTLAINQVRLCVRLACERRGYTLVRWHDEARMKTAYDRVEIQLPKGKRQSVSLIPDSYFVLETPRGRAHFFLELDRGTMTTKRFQMKVLAYQTYVASGAYERRYHTRSLRVLTVTTSNKRLENLKHVTEQAKDNRLFWFTTLTAVTPETVLDQPIWEVAGIPSRSALITPE